MALRRYFLRCSVFMYFLCFLKFLNLLILDITTSSNTTQNSSARLVALPNIVGHSFDKHGELIKIY